MREPRRSWRTARRVPFAPTSSATRSSAPRGWLVAAGRATGEELADDYAVARDEVQQLAVEVSALPQMASAEQVMAPLAPRSPGVVAERASRVTTTADKPLTVSQAVNAALVAILEKHPQGSSSARTWP